MSLRGWQYSAVRDGERTEQKDMPGHGHRQMRSVEAGKQGLLPEE